jgi:hypothetical protein
VSPKLSLVALAAATVLAAALAGAASTAPGEPSGLSLPDLVSDPPGHPTTRAPVEVSSVGGETRLLVRFDGYVHNAGPGPLEIAGTLAKEQPVVLGQYVQDGSGAMRACPPELCQGTPLALYEESDGHRHWHLMRAAEYSLWTLDRRAEVAPAEKVGFCLYDSEFVGPPPEPPAVYVDRTFCQRGQDPRSKSDEVLGRLQLRMGVSAGWRDVYPAHLALQWVDASNTAPGRYVVASRSDPGDIVRETDESNNGYAFADWEVVIPGYLAQPVGPVQVRRGVPRTVTLSAEAVRDGSGAPGALRYRITRAPEHGTLDRPVGADFASPYVRYTPAPGYSGPDSFEYAAVDATSPFPRSPVAAAALLAVGDGPAAAVAVSGAPTTLVAGTAVRLTATVAGVEDGVSWSVDGIPGGSRGTGTVTADGLYTAPAFPPPGGRVRIRATSLEAPWAYGEATVAITAPPPQIPAPSISGASAAHAGRLRLVIRRARGDRSSWSGWSQAFPALRSIARDGLRPGTRAAIAWRGRVWRGRGEVVRVARSLVRRFGAPPGQTLSRPVLERNGPWLVAHVVPGRAGTVVMVARHGRTRLLRCAVRTLARRPLTCGAALPASLRSQRVLDVHATARLFGPGGTAGTAARARV